MLKKSLLGLAAAVALVAHSPVQALEWTTEVNPDPNAVTWHPTKEAACLAWVNTSPNVQQWGASNTPVTGPVYVWTMFWDYGNWGYGYNGTHCALYMPTCIDSPSLCPEPMLPSFASNYFKHGLAALSSREPPPPPPPPPPPLLPPNGGTCPRADGVSSGQPIIPSTGEKILTEVDYEGMGPHALNLIRTYRSHRMIGPVRGAATSGLGNAWSHNHTVVISYLGTPGTANHLARVKFGDGEERHFNWDVATSTWKGVGNADTLVQGSPGMLYKRADDDSSWQFTADNKLLTKTERNGWVMTYAYNAVATPNQPLPGLLASVTNHFGRTLSFVYYYTGMLYSATAPDQQIRYTSSYAQQGGIESVFYPAHMPGYNDVYKGYKHTNASFPSLITSVSDEMGTDPFKSFAYDTYGRAISTQLSGGANLHTVAYGTATATVTDPLAKARTFSYGMAQGQLVVTGASAPSAGLTQSAASRAQDTNGFVTQQTDFLGVDTMYTWDATRRVKLSTTFADGRPEAKTVSTQWHSTMRLPVLVTEPGRTTAYTYDAMGNKLSQVVADTATGATRAWAWTYNAQQLIASETSPNGGVTQYAYDNFGQVTSMTDPLGRVTSYAYNPQGQLVTETGPTGLITTFTYTPRGNVLTRTSGGLTTYFSYRKTHQLSNIGFPSGYAIYYTFDNAQRYTGWTDNRGASAVYTLDAMGNRTGEQLKDGNTVVWQLARTINDLNRVTSETSGSGGTVQSETYGYNANGDLTSQTNGLSQSTSYGLDGLKRITAITNAAAATANLSYMSRVAEFSPAVVVQISPPGLVELSS